MYARHCAKYFIVLFFTVTQWRTELSVPPSLTDEDTGSRGLVAGLVSSRTY